MDRELLEQRKQTIYDFICDADYKPMKIKEIAILLNIPKPQRHELQETLDALIADGKIRVSVKGKYSKGEPELVTGLFESNARGYGFVTPEGSEEDIFIPASKRNGAFHQDMVKVRLKPSGGKHKEGEVVKILSHGLASLAGTYEKSGNYGFVRPDNPRITSDIFIPEEHSMGAAEGYKVIAEITDYGPGRTAAERQEHAKHQEGRNPEGRIIEIIGHKDDPGADILSIAMAYDLPVDFPEKVQNQAERAARPVSEADLAGRLDLRDVPVVTIDGEDAKDLDDAVSLSKEGGLYHLGVHIADVTNYVQENSALDAEALRRGTSVYLADRVIPMLPQRLSNGICSLNEGEDRLAVSCLMTIDEKGRITEHTIAESVIRVDRRMTYTDVNTLIAGEAAGGPEETAGDSAKTAAGPEEKTGGSADVTDGPGERTGDSAKTAAGAKERAGGSAENVFEKYREFVPMFLLMRELSEILRENRRRRGSIDFDFPEAKVIVNEAGEPLEICACERNAATDLIEDFMLAANETVAEDFYWRQIPFVYRTHENPDPEKIRSLNTQINNFGYHIRVGEEVYPKELQKLLDSCRNTPEEALISQLTLRSMKRAKYDTDCIGHFGLAARCYCHFTSPIRRYPDLLIHRIIKETLRGQMNEQRAEHYEKILPEIVKSCSTLERRADEAERETIRLKKVQYMKKHIGEEFEGVISGVTAGGFYVGLPDTVEGMVHVMSLDEDYFEFQESACSLVGEHTGITYRLGQRVRVRVTGVDERMRTIDFSLIR